MAEIGGVTDAPKGTSIWTARAKDSSAASQGDLGKDDFMKLLLAQLQNQDPLKPMDDQAFIAQVAQFNALEQMTKVNKTLEAVLSSQQLGEATGMIGKVVTGRDVDAKEVTGRVTAASVEDGVAILHIGKTKIHLRKVIAVAPEQEQLPTRSVATGSA